MKGESEALPSGSRLNITLDIEWLGDCMARMMKKSMSIDTLRDLARDLWWSWHEIGQRPFAALDPALWDSLNHNPTAILRRVPEALIEQRLAEPCYQSLVVDAMAARAAYYKSKGSRLNNRRRVRVAYFCSEFAVHESLQQYSGGLGVLAGDHVKSASDINVPLIGVGLLYRQGFYVQQLRTDGTTRIVRPEWVCDDLPVQDTGVTIRCPIGRRTIAARVWKLQVGRSVLYLLDSDVNENRPADRKITQALYQGEPKVRLYQQVLLGVGGMLALEALGEEPTVYHLNEGHAAFAALYRVARLMESGQSQAAAIDAVRRTTVFTTHTPVEAGHDRYEMREAHAALQGVLQVGGMHRNDLMALGGERSAAGKMRLCMTVLALKLSRFVNAVSRIHGEVSRTMWQDVYPDARTAEEVPITSVTNGVHWGTWLDPIARAFWHKEAGVHVTGDYAPSVADWKRVERVDVKAFWAMRQRLRGRLVWFVRNRLALQARRRGADSIEIARAGEALDPEVLTIGFARRMAIYKRANLLFSDLKRLEAIITNERRPVQIVMAGKAHPQDGAGLELVRKIYQWSQRPALRGRMVLLEEYDIHVGRMLTSGCDVWLNTPRRPYEACGTSGMKVPLHGGINCSIADGWWPEAFDGRNGWIVGSHTPGSWGTGARAERAEDRADAASLYDTLEREVAVEFYDRGGGGDGVPRKWIRRALHSAATVPPVFSSHRMVMEYFERAYEG